MKCPDCDGSAHGKHKAHWFKPTAAVVTHRPAKAVQKPVLVANAHQMVVNGTGVNKTGVNRKADRHRPGYMRDYMAQWRHT